MDSSLLSAGSHEALSRQAAGGGPEDSLRDLDAGQHELDINDPKDTHVLRALPGRAFSALELLCIMYAGFNRIEPEMDSGVDLGEVWEMAERFDLTYTHYNYVDS